MALYNPRDFATSDDAAIGRVVADFGFATLVTSLRGEVLVSHVPVLAEDNVAIGGAIIGHVAAANPHSAAFADGASLLIFRGPDGYVSPNWYEAPAASVPTWNYVAVHVEGEVERIDSAAAKRAIVDALSARHEAKLPRPWTSTKMDPALLERMLGAIVGFRIRIARIEAKFKLGQNRSADDRAGVIAGLQALATPGDDALAAWMRHYGGR
ncbi:MAG: FMN-binding negative transcriptional regulator [Betaproteobacteria bacterium]